MLPPRATTVLTEAPGWMLVGLLVFAPWAYGATRPWTIDWLITGMLVTLLVWVIGCIVRRSKPPLPWLALACIGYLLLHGWWLIANAQYHYDRTAFKFLPVASLSKAAPGAVDTVDAIPEMFRITALLGMIMVTADLARRPEWRARLWWAVGLIGTSIVLLGLAERVTDAQMIFWEERTETHSFFATYYYHANAGAFVNLILPLIFGRVLVAMRKRENSVERAIWIPALLIGLAGAIAAASKGALLVTTLMAVTFCIWRARAIGKFWQGLPSTALRTVAALGAVAAVAAIGAIGWTSMAARWTTEDWVSNSSAVRLLAYQVCLDMLPDSNWWGFGPGNFMITFPHYTNRFGHALEGHWSFAHNDYLQTLIEWGYVGAAVWAVLYFGGIVQGIRSYRNRQNELSTSDRILIFTATTALAGVALHAYYDFPLQIASLQLYAAVYLGIVWSSARWGFWNPPASPSRRVREKESPRVAGTNYP